MTRRPEIRRRHRRWFVFLPVPDAAHCRWVRVASQAEGLDVVAQWLAFRASWNGSEVGS